MEEEELVCKNAETDAVKYDRFRGRRRRAESERNQTVEALALSLLLWMRARICVSCAILIPWWIAFSSSSSSSSSSCTGTHKKFNPSHLPSFLQHPLYPVVVSASSGVYLGE
jgi:hypothetical protein